uniref:Uncharacterized protein n=1 Tax=Brassica campestris TaxID=3711 RepID=M4EH06_BRACM
MVYLHTWSADVTSTSIDNNIELSINDHRKPYLEVQVKDNTDYGYLTPVEFGILRDPEEHFIQTRRGNLDGRVKKSMVYTDVTPPNRFRHRHAGRHLHVHLPFSMSGVLASRHTGLCMSVRMRRSQVLRHLVLLCVELHGTDSCTSTPPSCVDTQQVKWLTPRPDPFDQATSSFSVDLCDIGSSSEFSRDENEFACAEDGRIIHVSKEDIRPIQQRAAIVGHIRIGLPEYAEEGSSVPGTEFEVPSSGDLEARGNDTGVFFPNSLPLISRFCHRSRGITCALKSTGVDHSQQAPLRQDPVPLVFLAWVPLKPKLILNPGNTFFLPILNSEPFRMTNGLDLALGSSLIEELRNAEVGKAPPPLGGDRLSPVGPLSVIGVEEVANWRKKFRLPDDVTIRIHGPFHTVSDFDLGEILVYEGVMSDSKGDEALAEYKKALEAMSARKAAVKRTAPVEDGEVQFVGSSRRQVTAVVAPSSSKKRSKAFGSVPKTPSSASFDWSAVLSNLNAKAFPLVPARPSLDGESFAAILSLQGDLLQRMEDKTTAKADVDALTAQLREGKDTALAKEKEIKA